MQSIVVSVGRAVGQEEQLSDGAWYSFRQQVQVAVSREGVIVFVGWGTGFWGEIREEAFTVIGSVQGGLDRSRLCASLEHLRIEYQQEAIALTVGDTVLVGPEV